MDVSVTYWNATRSAEVIAPFTQVGSVRWLDRSKYEPHRFRLYDGQGETIATFRKEQLIKITISYTEAVPALGGVQ